MRFEDFIKEGKVRKSSIDAQLAKSLLESSSMDLEFLGRIKVDKISARKVFSTYYDILRSILEARAALAGYKIYSHEAFTYYLKAEKEDATAEKFDRFRKIRNNINYYGKNISPEEVEQYKPEIIELITKIKSKIKGALR